LFSTRKIKISTHVNVQQPAASNLTNVVNIISSAANSRKVLVLVLVVDERGSFSAIDAHIFPCLIQTVLEDVD